MFRAYKVQGPARMPNDIPLRAHAGLLEKFPLFLYNPYTTLHVSIWPIHTSNKQTKPNLPSAAKEQIGNQL